MSKPKAVLISDVHYSVHTLDLADKSMHMAIGKANNLGIPLIVAGDLHDTKANLRGECVKAMIKTFEKSEVPTIVLIGNHDRINEKSPEHSLEFLRPHSYLIEWPQYYEALDVHLIPYQHDVNDVLTYLKRVPEESQLIMHQGVYGSAAGHYIQDKSVLPKEILENFRTISGHYHTRQDIKCGRPRKDAIGLFSYIGNPYTLGFGEARDPEKGYQILMDDGSLEFIPTNLRKHIIIEADLLTGENKWSATPTYYTGRRNDIIWVKVTGPQELLSKFDKVEWCKNYGIPSNIKLDLIPIDKINSKKPTKENMSQADLYDSIIANMTDTSEERKSRLKSMWRDFA